MGGYLRSLLSLPFIDDKRTKTRDKDMEMHKEAKERREGDRGRI